MLCLQKRASRARVVESGRVVLLTARLGEQHHWLPVREIRLVAWQWQRSAVIAHFVCRARAAESSVAVIAVVLFAPRALRTRRRRLRVASMCCASVQGATKDFSFKVRAFNCLHPSLPLVCCCCRIGHCLCARAGAGWSFYLPASAFDDSCIDVRLVLCFVIWHGNDASAGCASHQTFSALSMPSLLFRNIVDTILAVAATCFAV